MEVVTIEQAAEEAKVEWKEYCKAIRENIPNDAEYMRYYKSIKNALYHLSQGKHIIDINASMLVAGVNDKGYPKLAICKASMKKVFFEWFHGWRESESYGRYFERYRPKGEMWEKERNEFKIPESAWGKIERASRSSRVSTVVPKVPAQFMPKNGLANYHILWEVDEWTPEPPKDPMLLKQIRGSKNLFAVLAVWELTKLERAVLRGALM